jgi:hypothetical protein
MSAKPGEILMNDLLELAMAAHGGSDRWAQVKKITAQVAIGGGLWQLKGWPGVFSDASVSIDAHRQHVEYVPFVKQGQRSVYEPGRTAIVTNEGALVEERLLPREAFKGHTITTPWDAHHLIYFSGYAIWTYITTPFLFTLPGFLVEEGHPWQEHGETWRRLKVTFPGGIHSHSREQTFYFDRSGVLRRHDYSVDIVGGSASANYASDPKTFDGLVIPTKRRVYAIGPDNRPLLDRTAVSIDFQAIDIA